MSGWENEPTWEDAPEDDAEDPEAAAARALAGGTQTLAHAVVGGTAAAAGKLAGRVADVLPGGADWTGAPRKADTWGEAAGNAVNNVIGSSPESEQAEQAVGRGAAAVRRALPDNPAFNTALEAGGEVLQDIPIVGAAGRLPGAAARLAETAAGRTAQTIGNFGGKADYDAALAEARAAPPPPPPGPPTRAEFAPKPKITPKAGESPQAAAARQGVAPAAPAEDATPSAAPGAKGTAPPADVHDPAFFEAPDNQDLKSGPVGPTEQAAREAVVARGAPTLPQVRESAITNDYATQGRDWTGKQSADPVATAQIATEGQALHSEADRISSQTGGQIGTGESADRIRGQAYQDWHDTMAARLDQHIQSAYAAEDAAAKQIATPASNLKGVLTDDSLIDNANGASVRGSVIALGKKMGADLTDPNAQLSAYQVENLRKHANAVYSNAPRFAQAVKNAADADLPPGAYVQARKLKQLKSEMFDNNDGINQLGPSKDIDPATGKPRPGNRDVKDTQVMGKIEGMNPDQVQHITNTMKRSATVLDRLGDTEGARIITDKAHRAMQQLQSHFTEQWKAAAEKGGGWNTRAAHQYLKNNQETLAGVLSPEQMHEIRNVNNAANVLDLDKRYKGAFAQFQSGSAWRRALGKRVAGMAEGAATGSLGPIGGAVAEGTGIPASIRSGIERVVGGRQGPPKGFTRPLGVKLKGQGGWIGNMPEASDFANAEHVTTETPHEHFIDENGDHNFTMDGGNSWIKAEPKGNGLRVRASYTSPEARGQGNGGVLYHKAAEYATEHGGRLESDAIVSKDAARRWDELRRNGWDVKKDSNAKPTANGGLINEGDKPVFSTSGRAKAAPPAEGATGTVPMGQRPAFAGQRGSVPLGARIGGGSQRGSVSGKKVGPNLAEKK